LLSETDEKLEKKHHRFSLFVFDYDGTLTLDDGTLPESAQKALFEVSKMKDTLLGIVSGRDVPFLKKTNNTLRSVFSFLVGENGAVTYFSNADELTIKGREWTQNARVVFSKANFNIRFFEIIATARRELTGEITSLLKESNLDSKLVPNKDSIMVCPPNVDKGVGVASAVAHYGPTSEILLTCFGDGENDVALFGPADISVAVSNAVPQLKTIADVVTENQGGLGVEEYLRGNVLPYRERN
jgi:hydroxymethylpyrimidine pyrophosphatase-like HAD family hydrolase